MQYYVYLVKTRKQANSSISQRDTKASALPVAKYFPVGSNSMHMHVPGCAFSTFCNSKSG